MYLSIIQFIKMFFDKFFVDEVLLFLHALQFHICMMLRLAHVFKIQFYERIINISLLSRLAFLSVECP